MPISVTFSRILKYGLLNLWRYRWLSATAIVVMAVSLIVISSILVLNQLATMAATDLRDRVDVSVFFDVSVPESKILDVKAEFEKMEEVKTIRYISAEQALADFKTKHANEPTIQKSLEELGQNPLQPSLVVVAQDLSFYPIILQKMQNSRFGTLIAKINYEDSRNLIETLQRLTSGLRKFGFLLAFIFGFISVLVMFNTLRLTIFSRREEIEIMRLVGASNRYIRGPFLVEGVLYGLLGSFIASVILYPVFLSVVPKIHQFFNLDLPQNSFLTGAFWQLLFIQTLIGCMLGIFSSLIATRRHLKV